MIDVLEKVVWILTGLVLVLAGGWYLVLGAPSPVPAIAMQGRTTSKQELTEKLDEPQRRKLDEVLKESPREGETAKQYERQREEFQTINRAAFERMTNLTDAMHEAKTVSSKVIENKDGTNSLEVFDIPEGSVMGTIGFQDQDIIDAIGDENIDFSSRMAARELFYAKRDQLSSDGFIKIDIRRRNKPMKIIVNLEDMVP